MQRFQSPHPATCFCGLTILLVLITWMAEAYGLQTVHPATHEPVVIQSVLNVEGMRWLLRHAVSNLYAHSSLGQVLIGMLCIGLAYHSGFISSILSATRLFRIGKRGMIALVILLSVGSHLVDEVGYLLLLPLAASLFGCVGLPSGAGVLTAFIATGCSTMSCSLFHTILTMTLLPLFYWLSCRQLLLAKNSPQPAFTMQQTVPVPAPLTRRERRALTTALTAGALYLILLLWGTYALSDVFRGVNGGLLYSPLMEGMIPIVCLGLAWMSGVYGVVSGRYHSDSQLMEGTSSFLSLLCDYFVILFFAAQLSALFTYSNLGPYLTIKGAQWFYTLHLPIPLMLLLFILFTASINLLMVPTALKWQLFSPCFIPLFNELHMSPETTFSAFCIGESCTNIISPFMLYLPLALAYLRHYNPQANYFTLTAYCWRYCLALLAVWTLLLLLWNTFKWPFAL